MEFTLKQIRTYRGLTQDEMAEKLEISKSSYYLLEKRFERGSQKITIAQAKKISEILKLSYSKIVNNNEFMPLELISEV